MTEPKFTKGPWKVFKHTSSDGEIYVRVQTAYDVVENGENIGPETICIIGGYPTIPLDGGAEWEATGNLIAAAPDMYEALEEVSFVACATCSKYERYCESENRLTTEIPCNACESKVFKSLRKARGEEE